MRSPLFAAALLGSLAPAAAAIDIGPSVSVHGYGEVQLRMLDSNFEPKNADLSQWANELNVEVEADIAPNGWGPFSMISAYGRVLARYDCIYNGCGMLPTWRYYGDRATRTPANYATGRTNPYNGTLYVASDPARPVQPDNQLVDFFAAPPFDKLFALGAANVGPTFAPISSARFSFKDIDASLGNGVFPMGPWNPKTEIDPTGSLHTVPDPTLGLPLRPTVPDTGVGLEPRGLFVPSQAFVEDHGQLGDFAQNYSQSQLAWQHVDSQPQDELKELYVDAEMLDGRLWLRLGKQTIVWGKTELFRTTDQFNPQNLSLSSLPSLDESRIPLWSARATYSFYDVGRLEDVRLEVAANLDDFQPLDLGRCGEPYTVWLVCGKAAGLWSHGFAGIGIAGETYPKPPWQSLSGLEIGARLEWRWDRFSFQLSDFWGYSDAPTLDFFNAYERRVDPSTGRPLDVNGHPLVPGEDPAAVLRLAPNNRQLFDVLCSATKGIASAAFGGASAPQAIQDRCLLDITNSQFPLNQVKPPPFPFAITPANALSVALAGNAAGKLVVSSLAKGVATPALTELNKDPADGPGGGFFGKQGLSAYLTNQQEALLGCGPFYGTNCDVQGVDLFNTEASVLLQSFPQFEPNGPVATRYVPGKGLVILPGARGPADAGYSALVDGCVGPGPQGCNAGNPGRTGSARVLVNPLTGQLFRNELAAASYNFLVLLAALGASTGTDPGCVVANPFSCEFVRGVFAIAGNQRRDVRAGGNGVYGRRDFIWNGGSEISFRYLKRNVLGFATDFAHDASLTNWSLEATWMAGEPYAIASEEQGFGRRNTFNLTVSVDRPTFINFLNPNRTFFFNSQVFFRYIEGYEGHGEFATHGPLSALGTLTATTGYFQDRLLPAVTWVHDVLSHSGGLIAQLSYRFSQDFSATFGVASFYGEPDELAMAMRPAVLENQGGNYTADLRYDGLTAIAQRDEAFLVLRYTF